MSGNDDDLYEVLGVLPDADQVVITAAYRALIAKYHPDRWQGDSSLAQEMAAEINRAYATLGDAAKRAEYDSGRERGTSSFSSSGDKEEAFDEALRDIEHRWRVAVSVLPSLEQLRARLAKTSHRLAFAFVHTLLASRLFEEADSLAKHMEQAFLERHFGTNPEVLAFARELISMGERDAIRALNRLVDVMGSSLSEPLVTRIERDFGIPGKRAARTRFLAEQRRAHEAEQAERKRRQVYELDWHTLCEMVMTGFNIGAAEKLAAFHGYVVDVRRGRWFSPNSYQVTGAGGDDVRAFSNPYEFLRWAREDLARRPMPVSAGLA